VRDAEPEYPHGDCANEFVLRNISGMAVVQLFNRDRKLGKSSQGERQHVGLRDAILAYAVFYPAVEFLSFSTLHYFTGRAEPRTGAAR